jgi:hypothetical protein
MATQDGKVATGFSASQNPNRLACRRLAEKLAQAGLGFGKIDRAHAILLTN